MEPIMTAWQLGVSLNCIGTELSEELLKTAADSAISVFEMPAGFFPPDARDEAVDLVSRILPQRVGSVHAVFGAAWDVSSTDAEVQRRGVEQALDAVDLARRLDARMVVVHLSGEPIPAEERNARLERAGAALAEIAARAEREGVQIAVELLPRTCLGNTASELLGVVEPFDPGVVGVCLDVNHVMDRYRDLPEIVRLLAPRLIHLHLSDYDGVDEKHWMPGKGVIDWAALIRALAATGYAGLLHYESSSPAEGAAAKVRDFEENHAWLRGFLPEEA